MRKAIVVVSFGLLMLFIAGLAQAQEKAAPAAPAVPAAPVPAADVAYSYGRVVSVSADKIVVSEYDYDNDVEKEVTYAIDAKTTLENLTSVNDIAAGDMVEVEYAVEAGKTVAKNIFVEKLLEEELDVEVEEIMPPAEGAVPADIEE